MKLGWWWKLGFALGLAGPWVIVCAGYAERPRPATASRPSTASQPADDKPCLFGKTDAFRLNVADLWIGMESDYEIRRVRSAIPNDWRTLYRKDTTQENRDFRIREITGISLEGYLYDPNLLEYRADLGLGMEQARFFEKIDYFDHTSDGDGFVQRYDIAIDALKNKPVSFNGYARRFDDRIPRRFLPSLHEEITETGVSALATTGAVTTEVGYSYRDLQTRGNRLEEDDESVNLNRFYVDSKWTISERQQLRFNWDHEREKDTYQGSGYHFNTSRDEFRLEHELAFGPGDKNRLDTYLRYNEENGDLARDELEIVPRLTLQHTDKFKTIYRYSFYRTRYDDGTLDIGQHKLDAQALYTPNDEWRFSLDGFGLFEHVDKDVDTQQYGGAVEATYHKTTSTGEFSADLNVGYDTAHTTGTAGKRFVRAEAHALGVVRPVILRNRYAVPGSIIAHDEGYRRIFILGVDYTAVWARDWVIIQRVPWGRINENDVVYFDYQYEVPADGEVNSYRTDFRIEHAFNFGLTPYYYLETRCQQVDRRSVGTPLERDRQDRHRLGVRYGKDRWNVTNEFEIFDDSVEPYDAWHLIGQASILRQVKHSLDANGELSLYKFRGDCDKRRVWYFDMSLQDRVEITNLLSFNSSAEFRRECDDVRGPTTGVDAKTGLKYMRGYLTVSVDVEYDLLNIVENRENGLGVFLNVKRDLSHLLPSGREAP
jgi:hypothetical protein